MEVAINRLSYFSKTDPKCSSIKATLAYGCFVHSRSLPRQNGEAKSRQPRVITSYHKPLPYLPLQALTRPMGCGS
jgi:hypothetical protein